MSGKGRQWSSRFAALAAVLLFHMLTIVIVAYMLFFQADFMLEECEKYQVSSLLGINGEELGRVVEEMLLRAKGQGGDMDITVTVNGVSRAFFSSRDEEHLEDIAHVIKGLKIFGAVGVFALAGLSFILLRRGEGRLLCRSYLFFWLIWLLLLLVIGAWIALDLTGFINSFHRLFFRNTRWILNPAKDMLIWLFPRELFRDAAVLLAAWLAGIHGTVTVAAVCMLRNDRK